MGIGQCISFDDLHFPSSQSANMCGCGVKLLRTREGGESRRGTGAEDTYAGGDVVVVSRTLVGGGGYVVLPQCRRARQGGVRDWGRSGIDS